MTSSLQTTIVVLNYNGEKVLNNTIDSLVKQNYPSKKLEILIVDNASTDRSKNLIKKLVKQYSNVKYLLSTRNLGFSGGNNLGMHVAKGKYVAIVNNDCVVDKNWIAELIKTAESNPNIFAVNSKILLYPKYYTLKLKFLTDINIDKAYIVNQSIYPSSRKKIHLNVENNIDHTKIDVLFNPIKPSKTVINLCIINNSPTASKRVLDYIQVKELNPKHYRLSLIKTWRNRHIIELILIKIESNKLVNKIQNAGIFPFHDGYTRDIGSEVVYQHQHYEIDNGQYNNDREIYASCGAATLYKKRVLDRIGYFNKNFFMYYEDVELCERARRHGYISYYSAKAVVRHMHAFSSSEWSPFFIYHTERGRLMHTFYSFPFTIFLIELFSFSVKSVGRLLINPRAFKNNVQYLAIVFYFITNLPLLIFSEYIKVTQSVRSTKEANYREIISGRWLLN